MRFNPVTVVETSRYAASRFSIVLRGTWLKLGASAVLKIMGQRKPGQQIERFRSGLLRQVPDRKPDGTLIGQTGVMSIMLVSAHVFKGQGQHRPSAFAACRMRKGLRA